MRPFSLSAAADLLSVNFVFKPLHSLLRLKTKTGSAKNEIAGSFIGSNDTIVEFHWKMFVDHGRPVSSTTIHIHFDWISQNAQRNETISVSYSEKAIS